MGVANEVTDPDEDVRMAINVRDAAAKLEAALRDAASAGLIVSLSIADTTGFVRGKDRTTSFPRAVIDSVYRPI
jgi:hypothetical protein